jgi:phage terminase large subunit
MDCNIKIDADIFNPVYLPYLDCDSRTQIFFGGASSGKSVFLAQRCVYDLLKGGRNYLVMRNVSRSIRTSIFNEIKKVIANWNVSSLFKINETEMEFTCKNGYQIISKGLDDVQKIKSITPRKGIITDIFIDEATEIKADDYRQLTKRLRGESKSKKRIILSFNPIMKTHWLFKEFFKEFHDTDHKYKTPELSILKTTYRDNKFLTDEDRQALISEKNEYYFNVYSEGKWGVLGHLIFTNWRVENLAGLKNAFGSYYNGLDVGFTNDPTALARCAKKEKTIYITHEMYEYGMLVDQIAERVKPIIQDEVLRVDPTSPRVIQELKGYGVNAIGARTGKGSVNHGIQYLQQHEIIIDRECQNAINELQVYQWDTNKDGQVMNVPVDRDNHFIDALRYSLSGISFMDRKTDQQLSKAALGFR